MNDISASGLDANGEMPAHMDTTDDLVPTLDVIITHTHTHTHTHAHTHTHRLTDTHLFFTFT